MRSPETWMLIGICAVIAGAIALVVIKTNPRCSSALRRWQQRRIVRQLRQQLPRQLKQEKERLCQLWNGNPGAQCASILNGLNLLNRLNRLNRREENPQELADDTDRALIAASSHFRENFTDRYADLYSDRLVVRTTEIAKELAAQYPQNAELILQRLSQTDAEIARRLNESIRDALAEGQEDQEEVRAYITQLIENSDRFRSLLLPGFFRQYGSWVFGGVVTWGLHELLPDWIKGPWIEYKTTRFAQAIFAGFQSKRDQEFFASYAKALAVDLPALCERLDARVGQALSAALNRYIEHKLVHQRAVLDVLLELSHRKCDLESGISWFQNAFLSDASAIPLNWSRLFATAGVVVFIGAVCAVWFYSPLKTKAPVTASSPEKQGVPVVGGRSQMEAEVTLTGTGTMTPVDQSTPASAALMTPVMLRPPEYLASRADIVEQKKTTTNRAEHRALQSPSPDAAKYPLAPYAGRPGYYRSPYTGRVYNLRDVRDGGLVRDPDTGQFFRRPWQKK